MSTHRDKEGDSGLDSQSSNLVVTGILINSYLQDLICFLLNVALLAII